MDFVDEKTAASEKERAELAEKLKEAREAAEALRGEVERLSRANDLSKMTLGELSQSQRAAPQFPIDTALKMDPLQFADAVRNHLDGQLASLPAPRMDASLAHWTKGEVVAGTLKVVRLHEEIAAAPEGQRWLLQKQLEEARETLVYHSRSLGVVPILKL